MSYLEQLEQVYADKVRNDVQESEYEVIVDVNRLIDCITAFEKKRRILKRQTDLSQLKQYAKYLYESTERLQQIIINGDE